MKFQTFTQFLLEYEAHPYINDKEIKLKLENPNTSLEELRNIFSETINTKEYKSQTTSSEVQEMIYKSIAQHKNADNELLLDIYLASHSPTTLIGVAGNPNASPSLLKKLATTNSSYVKAAIAGNPNTSHDVLKYFAASDNMFVLENIVKNPNVTEEILKFILNVNNADTRIVNLINKKLNL